VFHTAIVRPPSASFARGLTRGHLGPPDLERALAQHRDYVRALEHGGVRVIALEPDDDHPDSTFVEDAAVLLPGSAVLTHPGAPSRRGEVAGIRRALEPLVPRLRTVETPGTLDGGDICQVGSHYLIGLSERTNDEGARQLETHLADEGCTSERIVLGQHPELLHLKSGLAWLGGRKSGLASLGDRRMMATRELIGHPALRHFEVVEVDEEERAGANGIRLGEAMLIPSGCPLLEARLRSLGLAVIALEMSEFQKMDGGISCLSLRLGEGGSEPT
jgi:dimethylargininase